ncbi:MAG: alginate lyase family protein [Phaeodactylibacter sp.]|nr:alginate lyase family protein [Phaeodactylibacter sp.]
MIDKLKLVPQIVRNMGWRYVRFRAFYELKRKTGLLKSAYPVNPAARAFISLEEWRAERPQFFFDSKADLSFPKEKFPGLKEEFEAYKKGKLLFFNALQLDIGADYDWVTNPVSGYRYNIDQHWTEVEDITQEAGDIKYTWEKSRFSFLYTLLRYDYHFEEDCAEAVFGELESWLDANPINAGPNYKCSQEISLRVMNWTFALHYYSDHPALTEARFQKIMHGIYWMLKHVEENIHFSRISVRNNHAITETTMLYLAGLLFPFYPEAGRWKTRGKQWLEEEIAYQIYEDGTHLQFSMNYHRVVLQCLTWAFYLSELNGEDFLPISYQRAQRSLQFLYAAQNLETGYLPNYGANDGALFFKWNNADYRDYRPQLNALHYYFNRKALYTGQGTWQEDVQWLAGKLAPAAKYPVQLERPALQSFKKGGYYMIRDEKDCFSFIRCGKHKDRPSQTDNLHLDIWAGPKNILRDTGSYRYNTSPEWLLYFNGTQGHNTVALGEQHQMLKGPRFIWLHWSQALDAGLRETEDAYIFEGKIQAFQQVEKGLVHQRQVIHYKAGQRWEITDTLRHSTSEPLHQYWHIDPAFDELGFQLEAVDGAGNQLEVQRVPGFYSSYYGIKEPAETLIVTSATDPIIKTTIYRS